jgi:hypothetical protein
MRAVQLAAKNMYVFSLVASKYASKLRVVKRGRVWRQKKRPGVLHVGFPKVAHIQTKSARNLSGYDAIRIRT